MNPFIPLKRANLAIVAGNADKEIFANLKRLQLQVIPTVKCKDVDESISYHPDIVIHPLNHNTLVIAPNVFDYYKDRLSGRNIKIIKGEKELHSKYPLDIAYNVGRIKNKAIHNFDYTDELLKFYLKKENLEFIDIKQGYSKCSMAIIDENNIITSDLPLYNKLSQLGYNNLLINSGNVHLEKQNYGFIGGATGNLSSDLVMFSGILDKHPDKENIKNFISSLNKKVMFLSNNHVLDIGTIISLYCN